LQVATNMGAAAFNVPSKMANRIGDDRWIGMNAIILLGVELRSKLITGAGLVATSPFFETVCLIVGFPARINKHSCPR
jgi:acetyltransferase-like isoleucine patch superfamily enzyme